MKKIETIRNGKISDLIRTLNNILDECGDTELCVCGTKPVIVYYAEDTDTTTVDYDEDLADELSNKELERYCVQNWNGAMCHDGCEYKEQCEKYIEKYGHTPLFGKEV